MDKQNIINMRFDANIILHNYTPNNLIWFTRSIPSIGSGYNPEYWLFYLPLVSLPHDE
jgi:hypothetical protein